MQAREFKMNAKGLKKPKKFTNTLELLLTALVFSGLLFLAYTIYSSVQEGEAPLTNNDLIKAKINLNQCEIDELIKSLENSDSGKIHLSDIKTAKSNCSKKSKELTHFEILMSNDVQSLH